MQRNLYSYLVGAGHSLVFSDPRDVGMSPVERARGLLTGFRPARGEVDVYLSTVPPLPFGVDVPLMSIVCDLRWLRTRSKASAAYRAWDLRRTIRRSDSILCISRHTRRELERFDARATCKALYQWLGPGQITGEFSFEHNSGLLLMIGGAAHKRNERAAAVLAEAHPSWVKGVIGVGVTEQVRESLSKNFACEWHQSVSDSEILELYRRAEYFMMLGTDEGFGLPFVEALAAGCQVIATEHPLAREVLGAAGILLRPGSIADQAAQLNEGRYVAAEVRRDHAGQFSWSKFGQACESELLRIGASSSTA